MIFLVHTHSPSITVNTAKRLHKWHNDGDWFPSVSPLPIPHCYWRISPAGFSQRVWNFFAAKDQYQNINAQHLPILVSIMENSTCVHLKEKKPARLYLKVYFTMPNITVNLKLKARNMRDCLDDKPMPK